MSLRLTLLLALGRWLTLPLRLLLALALLLLPSLVLALRLSLGLAGALNVAGSPSPLLALLKDHVAGGGSKREKRLTGARRTKHDSEGGAANARGADGRLDRVRGALPVFQLLNVTHELAAVEAQGRDRSRGLLLQLSDLDRCAEGILQEFLKYEFGFGTQPCGGAVGEYQHDGGVLVGHDLRRLRDLGVNGKRCDLSVQRHLHPTFNLSHQDDAGRHATRGLGPGHPHS